MVFSVVLYRCESWTIKKAECWRIDAFKLWFWKRLLRVPWTAWIKPVSPKRNQPWIFIGRTDAEAEAPVFWPPAIQSQFIGKTLLLGRIEGKRRRGQQRIRWLDSITDSMNMNLSKFWEIVNDRGAWHAAVHGLTVRHDLATEQQQQIKILQTKKEIWLFSKDQIKDVIFTYFLRLPQSRHH